VVAAACVVTGVANGVEDALGFSGFGPLYVIGDLVSGLGTFAIAAMFWASPARRLTFVPCDRRRRDGHGGDRRRRAVDHQEAQGSLSLIPTGPSWDLVEPSRPSVHPLIRRATGL